MNNYCEYTVLRILEVRSAFRFPIKREETNQTDGIKKKSGDLFKTKNRPWNSKENTLNAPCRKYVETMWYLIIFVPFCRLLFQLAHLLLDVLQHRVRTYRSLDYAFRRLDDASLHFWFLNFGFLGSQNVLPRPTEPTANTWVGKLMWLSGVWMVVVGFSRFLNLSPVDFSFISLIVVLHFYSLLRYECILVMNV